MGKPPYDDADTLDSMRSDAHEVKLPDMVGIFSPSRVTAAEANAADGFEVPADAVALGELHFHLE